MPAHLCNSGVRILLILCLGGLSGCSGLGEVVQGSIDQFAAADQPSAPREVTRFQLPEDALIVRDAQLEQALYELGRRIARGYTPESTTDDQRWPPSRCRLAARRDRPGDHFDRLDTSGSDGLAADPDYTSVPRHCRRGGPPITNQFFLRHLSTLALLLAGLTTNFAWSAEPPVIQSFPVLRAETVTPMPRPLTEPRIGTAPIATVGGRRDVLPDPTRAIADPVSPESCVHLEALTREFRQR